MSTTRQESKHTWRETARPGHRVNGRLPQCGFSVDEANLMLPLVRKITDDVMRHSRSIRHLGFRLKFIAAGGEEIEQMFPREIGAMRKRLDDLQWRLDECLDELARLGVEPELPSLGLIDFPSVIDETPAYLCWRHGEPNVTWWHSLTGGFVDRRPVNESSMA